MAFKVGGARFNAFKFRIEEDVIIPRHAREELELTLRSWRLELEEHKKSLEKAQKRCMCTIKKAMKKKALKDRQKRKLQGEVEKEFNELVGDFEMELDRAEGFCDDIGRLFLEVARTENMEEVSVGSTVV